jgi:hypothetical protein
MQFLVLTLPAVSMANPACLCGVTECERERVRDTVRLANSA